MRAAPVPVSALAALLAAAGLGSAAEREVVRVEASSRGFRPDTISLRRGEVVRIVLTSADGPHCFAVDALRVEKRILPGRETSFDLLPEEAGSFPFYCCLEKGESAERERGLVVVGE